MRLLCVARAYAEFYKGGKIKRKSSMKQSRELETVKIGCKLGTTLDYLATEAVSEAMANYRDKYFELKEKIIKH